MSCYIQYFTSEVFQHPSCITHYYGSMNTGVPFTLSAFRSTIFSIRWCSTKKRKSISRGTMEMPYNSFWASCWDIPILSIHLLLETPIFTPKIPEFHPKYGIFATFCPFWTHFPHSLARCCTFAAFLIKSKTSINLLTESK